MLGMNYHDLQVVRERQAAILEERRKVYSSDRRLSLSEMLMFFFL